MIPEIGHYALILAFCLAITQSALPLLGVIRHRISWMQVAYATAYGQLFFISIAFFALAFSFVSNDFSVAYVANNSNSYLPLIYRFCALWGAHEGSLLLWVFVLSIWMSAVAMMDHRVPLEMMARVQSVLGMVSVGFLLFLLTVSNPFARVIFNAPLDGLDLNPLLQDPGLVTHPPVLYIGYVGFAVVFAFAIAALITHPKQSDESWIRWARPWILIAWCFLTLGIVLGSWWAYRVLGWGGWWFWDPVENASLMPWLAGTALIHSMLVAEKRHAFKAWTILLAICTFSLSLLGTFLVRSGVLISVHAFAVDSSRGIFMLKFLCIVVGSSLLLYALRAAKLRSVAPFQFFSRETMLLSNNVLLMTAMFTILLGTLYPLVIDILGVGKISVGPPYFNLVFLPIMILLLLFMGMVSFLNWRDTKLIVIGKKILLFFSVALGVSLLLISFVTQGFKLAVVLGLTLALWVIIATVQSVFVREHGVIKLKKITAGYCAMMVAHLGIAVCAIGIVLTSNYSVQKEVRMMAGDMVSVGPYQFRFLGVRNLQGVNYTGVEGGVSVSKNKTEFALLRPQLRSFTVQKTTLGKTAIDVGWFRDLYVALGEPLSDDVWSLRIYYKPFVRWIWVGGLIMVLGGLIGVVGKKNQAKC